MEIQLADEMGVSRTPVREAIRTLELEGFAVMIPRRGTYVADISIKDITEIYEVRTCLDVLAAGLAAERITDEELESMNGYLHEIGQHVANRDMNKIVEVDTAFHDVLYNASRHVPPAEPALRWEFQSPGPAPAPHEAGRTARGGEGQKEEQEA